MCLFQRQMTFIGLVLLKIWITLKEINVFSLKKKFPSVMFCKAFEQSYNYVLNIIISI